MAGDAATESLNRTLKEISASLKTQNRILEALNSNLLDLCKRLPVLIEETSDA